MSWLIDEQLYLVTFEILFQFLEDSLAASHAAHRARESRPKFSGKQFKGTAPLGRLQDLRTAAQLFRLEIPEQVLKDELLLSHISVARTVEAMPGQAVLGFRAWCGLPHLAGMNLKTGEVAQTFVVCLLAALRTVEMKRSHIHDLRQRDDGFVLFCFVWLPTLGMPAVAPGTAAGPFRRVAEAPYWVPSSPVVGRGALSTEVPPHLGRGEVPGRCRPGHGGEKMIMPSCSYASSDTNAG